MRFILILVDIIGAVAIFAACGPTWLGFGLTVGLFCFTTAAAGATR